MSAILARLIEVVCWAYNIGLLILVVAGYIRARWANRLKRSLSPFYEPALSGLRRALPSVRFGRAKLDLSPVALFLLVILFRNVVIYILLGS